MNNSAFRTLVIEKAGSAYLRDGLLCLDNEDGSHEFAISQLSAVVIMTPALSVTSALLAELAVRNVTVIVCNSKKLPAGECHPIGATSLPAARIQEQAKWSAERKQGIWREIVKHKIGNSAALLCSLGKKNEGDRLLAQAECVTDGDMNNREAICAKIYFHALFGYTFSRDAHNDINAALNYGYSILASHISRFLCGNSYSPALGIHHGNAANFWNLTYDLIEPFRVFVDRRVYARADAPFDGECKKILIENGETPVLYNGRKTILTQAMDQFCTEVLRSLSEENMPEIGRVELV